MNRSARYTLVAAAFGLGMALLDVTAVNVAVPAIQASLHTDVRGLSWVIDGYTLAFASLLLLSGGLGDRLGARRVFLTGIVLFTVASALCGAAPSLELLIFARIVQGVGAALFMPSSLAILRYAYPDAAERARAIGVWSALTAIAGASGPLLGGLMVSTLGWRSIFLLNLPLGVAAIVMTLRFVRPSLRTPGAGFDLVAQLTAAGSLALLTWALIEKSARGWGSPVIVLAFATSIVGMVSFVFLEKRAENPILPLRLFQSRTFSSVSAAAMLYAGAFFGTLLIWSLFFQRVRGESAALAGLHIGAITTSFGITSLLCGRLVAKHGARVAMLAGLITLTISAWLAASLPSTASFAAFVLPLMMMGIGAGLVAPSANAAILASVPPQLSGIGAGVLNAARQVGTALGVALFASQFHGEASTVRVCLAWAGVVYLIAFGLATRMTPEKKEQAISSSEPAPSPLASFPPRAS
jgi:MFS transporter, DHA2 family, methylenomycin A resistance protein